MVHLGRIHFFRTTDEFRFEIFRNPWRKSNFRTPTLYELGNQTQNHPKPPILSTWVSTWSPAELNLSSGSSNWCSNDVETSSGRRSEPNDSNLWFKSFNEITIGIHIFRGENCAWWHRRGHRRHSTALFDLPIKLFVFGMLDLLFFPRPLRFWLWSEPFLRDSRP